MDLVRHRPRRRTSSAGADVSQPEPSQPPNKKLRSLENLDSEPEDEPVDSSGNVDIHNVLKEIAAYLALTILTQEEKLSALLYWKRHCEVYTKLSALAIFFLTLSASSVGPTGGEYVFSRWTCEEFKAFINRTTSAEPSLFCA